MKVTVEQKVQKQGFAALPVGSTFVSGAILAACSEVYVKRADGNLNNAIKLSNMEVITIDARTECASVQITEIKTRVL